MRIQFNLKGPKRKELAQAVSSELNAPVKYLGAPSFAYEVGEYQVDKEGTLDGPDNRELVADLQGLHSFTPEDEEYDAPLPQPEPIPDDISIPWEVELGGRVSPYSDYDEPPLHDSVASDEVTQASLASAIGGVVGVSPDYLGAPTYAYKVGDFLVMPDGEVTYQIDTNEDLVNEVMARLNGQGFEVEPPDKITIDIPLEGFTKQAIENLKKLIASKESLIKKAIGASDLSIEQTKSTLKFPWFPMATGGEVEAYAQLIHGLCDLAKKRKRITAKERPVENEKFTFRVFLIQLGFVGDEYKQARKILLKNLKGNSAFRYKTEVAGNE